MIIGNITLTESWDSGGEGRTGVCRSNALVVVRLLYLWYIYPAKDSGPVGAPAGQAIVETLDLYMCIYVNSEMAVLDL